MKKKFIILSLIAGSMYLVLTGYSAGPGTGFPPVEGTGVTSTGYCGTCHGVSSSFVTNAIVLQSGATPVTSYTPGGSYTIVMTGQYASSTPFLLPRFGFQLSATTSASANAGTLSAIAGTHAASPAGVNVIEHNSAMPATTGAGAVGSTYVVNIPWTAPAAGTGSVTIRGTINAVNHDGMSGSSDQWKNASLVVTEAGPAIPPIAGTATMCVGGTTTLTHPTAGGAWSSANPAVATVASSGVVTGVAAGTALISYTVSAGTATRAVTVSAAPDAVVTGSTTVCVGHTVTLGGAPTGGTWTSAAVTKATVGSSSGIVVGVATGTAVIKYKVTTACGTDSATVTMNVVPAAGCPTSVPAVSAEEEGIKVFPNPNYGTFRIAFSSLDGEPANIVISNVIGVQVREVIVPANGTTSVSLSSPAGMYIIRATTSRRKYVTRVSVE